MKRARFAIVATTVSIVAISMAGTDARRPIASTTMTPLASHGPSPTGSLMVSPLWRIDVPTGGGPFNARLSPDARFVAVESASARTGVVLHEIVQPVPPSDVARLRELVRLDGAVGPVQWLRDSSGLLAYEPDGNDSTTGVLSLVDGSGKRWSIRTTGLFAQEARFSPDGRYAAFWTNPSGALLVALDGSRTFPLAADPTRHFSGWDSESNLLFHSVPTNTLEARALDGRAMYSVPLSDELQEMGAGVPTFLQPSDVQLLSFDTCGRCYPGRHDARFLFDRALHDLPVGVEPILATIGDGPWRGRELTVRREVDAELMALDPRTGATRSLGAALPPYEPIWGFSGDYLAWGRHIVQLSTGHTQEWTVQPAPESIIALGSGRFVLWRDGTTELLDATAWFAAPQSWTGELPLAADQRGLSADWERVRDEDGGFTIARPRSWSSYEGRARGATLASSGVSPTALPGAGEVRVEIRLDIIGPRGPGDFLDGLANHGGRVSERRTVQLPAGTAEFAVVFDNTIYPKPATTLNWAMRSPFLPDRVVWIRAWPLDSGRRAEVEAVVATLEFVAPR